MMARNAPLTILVNVLLIVGLLCMAAPFVWMLSTSFKGTKDIFRYPPKWIPDEPTLDNYRKLFRTVNIGRPFMNTVITAVSITALSLLICSMAGYAFAKFEFPGKNALFMGVLGTLMIPGQITMIPVFLLLKKMGLLNTYSGLILPGIASAFGIFFMRQFIITLPNELLEAARIDGAGEFFIFSRIVLPLCKPALATLGILNFTGSWNNFLWPLIISTDESMYTLPVAVANLAGQYATEYGLQMAGSVMVIMPSVVFFMFAQQWFMEGVAMTGMKG